MSKFLTLLLSACLSVSAFAFPTAPAGYTSVIASNISDASGNPLASGTATFQVVDASGRPLSVQIGGFGQVHTAPVSVQVVNGAFTATVVDISQTTPSFPCVTLTIIDNSSGSTVWQNNCLQPTGGTYDLDLFSTNTTPVQPQAGDTLQGDLHVNGNFYATGNFNTGGLAVGNLSATYVTSENVNGVLVAAQFPGADIGAKANAAYASCTATNPYNAVAPSACHVLIPAGNYSYSTDIVIPKAPLTTLEFEAGAVLKYTGSGYAINMTAAAPNWGAGNYQGNWRILGPGLIIGTASGKAGLLMYGTNGAVVRDIAIDGFSQGDGILNAGLNSFSIEDTKLTGNLVGLHIAAAPQAASNNGHIVRNVIAGNTWGVIDGDMSQFAAGWLGLKDQSGNPLPPGVSSPNFGNRYVSNDLERNGAGAVLLGLTVGDSFTGNYFEASPRGIVVGDVEQPLSSAQLTRLYGRTSTNGGSASGTSITGNYFTTASSIHSLVELRAAGGTVVDANGGLGNPNSTACGVDIYSTTTQHVGLNTWAGVASDVCQGGGALTTYANTSAFGETLGGLLTTSTNVSTISGGADIVGQIGSIQIIQSTVDPGGLCGGQGGIHGIGLWFTPDGIYLCQGVAGQNGVWTRH